MIEIMFVISAVIAVICALYTINSHNVVYALLFMVIMMLAIAIIFFLLGASFAAALQVIVYAGAIMVLFIFVTMMLHQGERSIIAEANLFSLASAWSPLLMSLTLFTQVMVLLNTSDEVFLAIVYSQTDDTTKALGELLFGPYYQLIILAALMLLSALISAIHIAMPNSHEHEEAQ